MENTNSQGIVVIRGRRSHSSYVENKVILTIHGSDDFDNLGSGRL